jgi:hypothetical protein
MIRTFYRYLIYKLYTWGLKRKNYIPFYNTILILSLIHLIQLFTLVAIVYKILGANNYTFSLDKVTVIAFSLAFFAVNFLLFYKRKQLDLFIREFGDESEEQRKRGNSLIRFYLIATVISFYLSLFVISEI